MNRLLLHLNILISPILLFTIGSCTATQTDFEAECTEEPNGTYTLKWETYPPMNGKVSIYRSFDAVNYNQYIASVPISDCFYHSIPTHSKYRSYFRLIFNRADTLNVATRHIRIEGTNNFRDIGGYSNCEGQQIKWGEIYRCGSFNRITDKGVIRLKSLGIKTLVDLRTTQERTENPLPNFGLRRVVTFPVEWINYQSLYEKLHNGTFKRGDGILYMQDCYLSYLNNSKKTLKPIFDLLTDRNNYPILLHCSLGKDQTGFTAALILKALNVQDDTVMRDYMLSNEYIDYENVKQYAAKFPEESFDGFAMLYRARPEYIQYIRKKILDEHGTAARYLNQEIGVTPAQIRTIRKIMLETSNLP